MWRTKRCGPWIRQSCRAASEGLVVESHRPPVSGRRGLQIALGLLWLLDGALQLQPYMFGKRFATGVIQPAMGQPALIGGPITWAAHLVGHDPVPWNAAFAVVQLAIGAGLLVRRTVRPALVVSFGWAFGVWWLGEGFGELFAGMASPLTGAPGAVLLCALIGALAWPPHTGTRSRRTGRLAWAGLWCADRPCCGSCPPTGAPGRCMTPSAGRLPTRRAGLLA
jgi:hypothetical protein